MDKIRTTGIDGQFAAFITLARTKANLNKSQLAVKADVKRTTILMMERDKGNPNIDTAWKILRGLGMTFNDFEQYIATNNNARGGKE